MAPYFSVYPLPVAVGTNAAVLAAQYHAWTVRVLDGKVPIEVRVEPFGSATAIRPVRGWPPDRALEVVATSYGMEKRHPFHTASGPHTEPPRCEWSGPYSIHPKGPEIDPTMWPTNAPIPPRNQRMFSVPAVASTAGYLVSAQLVLDDRERNRIWRTEATLTTSSREPGQPLPFVALTPASYDERFGEQTQIIGMTLVDVAGNTASYGRT